ncbi:LOW QUALITY PROTEIN: complement C4-A-like [Dama dama]
MRLLWGLIWASGFFALSLQKPRLLLFSPSVVRIGVPLSVAVKLQDAPSGQVVRGSVFLRNPSHINELCSPKVDFSLSSDRDFILLNLPIPQERARICRLHLLRGAPKVQLMVQSSWLRDSLSKQTDMQGVNLLFSSRRGHLFLQTDQPVYNPGQRVRYRVFALDQKMRPATDILTVTVENSQGFRVQKREVVAPSSIIQDNFLIPDISAPATKISARFSHSLDSNSSTQFEVKKYVLPNFEVKIIPENPYILTTPGFLSDIQVIIQARYIYGKPVQGVAYVRFGLLGEDGEKTFLRGLESQTKLVDGQCQISLQKAEFQGVLEKLHISINDLPGLRLYVAAAVIESPGGELEETELTSWRFVSSPFSLDLSKTKQQLIPGVPFLLQARVRDMSGSPASSIPDKVSAKLFSGSTSKNEDFERNTDGSGQVIVSIGVPPTISEVQLSVSAGSPHPAIGGLTVKAPLSRSSGFLSIEWQNPRPLKVGETLNLNLQAVGISGSFSHFYYMILSRGQIVSVHREPKRHLTSISVFVDHHLVPSFHLVAFYYHGGIPVANSLRVDVQAGTCEGKLELNVDSSKAYRPGDTVKLNLQTESRALVALGAVDTALYAVGGKSHKPLDMVKVFEAMNSYDLGCGLGGGDSAPQVFKAAGLAFSDGDHWTEIRKSLFPEFHMHLRLPCSVRCFEQLELRPVLYNYLDRDLTVSVHVSPVEGLCLAGGRGLAQQVQVPAGSARPVGFSVVPIAAAAVSLKVVARGSLDFPVGDAISKILQVEREGAIHREELVYELNPLDPSRTLEIPGNSDPNIIPKGDFKSVVSVTASDPLEALGSEGALSPGGLASLLRLPQGCGEQTMTLLAPTLAASCYLDKTEQWSMLPPETKDRAVDLIQKGYTRIQEFRKGDGSYGAWLHRDSSTWAGGGRASYYGRGPVAMARNAFLPSMLTAFVLKILSLAQDQVGGSPEKLQETAMWLLSQQWDDGSFHDACPVIHREMQGGLVGSDETVALTAFVVIALHHGLAVFPDKNSEQLRRVENSISRANTFLGAKVTSGLLGSHASAITAYALSLTEAPEDLRSVAHNNLMAMAQDIGGKLYWGSVTTSPSNVLSPTLAPRSPADPIPQVPAMSNETTAYGLLHLLLWEGKAELADQAASWLSRQGSFQGGYRSTQDTVMALDALSAYWIASHTTEEKGLNVTLSSLGRSGLKSHVLQLTNHQVHRLEEELQFSLGSKINVEVGGNSKGTLKVLRSYNVMECQDLQIKVMVVGHVEYTSVLRSHVSHFETKGPHVLLYFDSCQVPTSRECVGFGSVQEVPMGLVQPARAILYDYYPGRGIHSPGLQPHLERLDLEVDAAVGIRLQRRQGAHGRRQQREGL